MSINLFEEYLEKGQVIVRVPNILRSKFLLEEAQIFYSVVKKFIKCAGIDDKNANYFIKNMYDVIMEPIRARMFADGFQTRGEGAHEVEISYLRKMGFKEDDIKFVDRLRYFRNGILYYGEHYNKGEAEKTLKYLNSVYDILCSKKKAF